MDELEQNQKIAEAEQFTKQERRQLRRERNQEERRQEHSKNRAKKIITITGIALVVGGGIFALVWFAVTQPNLPPTSQVNHSENSPSAHIVTRPIGEGIQRHMLEHADGVGPPGVIIQYNCEDFECETDLVQRLTTLVEQYPENVYLAPNTYDGMIILTKEPVLQILDSFDEEEIRSFIGR